MLLSDLLDNLAITATSGPLDREVTGLCYDSRQVAPGSVFFALPGAQADGHQFVEAAAAKGAVAVVVEREIALPAGVSAIRVGDSRRAMAQMARRFFGDPAAGMTLVGVTGTNGKTTVTYLVESMLRRAGRRPGVIGTVAYRFEELTLPAPHTTPESVDLFRTLARFRDAGCDALVMEVSSHALAQSRTAGLHFDVGIFTNLTPEHLDYHQTMDEYFASKLKLFAAPEQGGARLAVVNRDDSYGALLCGLRPDALSCGSDAEARLRVLRAELSLAGIEAEIGGVQALTLRSPLLGRFNLQNLLCAAGAGVALGLSAETIAAGLEAAARVPGRLEAVANDLAAQILVDYAHTADALDKALQALRDLEPTRVLTVFGCGGDRDRTKRPQMGAVAARHSDLVVATSDNPRTEDPLAILAQIRPGIETVYPTELSRQDALAGKRGYVVIPDRRQAIDFAVSALGPGDVLLVAGKGHEDYQILGREKIHFDDREELRRAVAQREQTA